MQMTPVVCKPTSLGSWERLPEPEALAAKEGQALGTVVPAARDLIPQAEGGWRGRSRSGGSPSGLPGTPAVPVSGALWGG